jgi:NCS1 family nucleobase:cation symporter-1
MSILQSTSDLSWPCLPSSLPPFSPFLSGPPSVQEVEVLSFLTQAAFPVSNQPKIVNWDGPLSQQSQQTSAASQRICGHSPTTRYARKPGDQVLAQLIMVPLGTIVVACIGIVCTSCAATLYPQEQKLLWNPYVFLEAVRKYEDNQGARAGVAFASIAFMLSQFGIVVASNLVVAGIDLAALLPRWFTIRRGAYFTILFAFIMQPWSLLNSATDFLTVVGSFNIFLGPLMGIMFADYFILRKTTMKLTELYSSSPTSIYWYTKGWNWRAGVAWVAGMWYLLPGLVQRAVAPGEIWSGWTRPYQLAWFLGCLSSGMIYLVLDYFWPMPEKHAVDDQDYFGTFGDPFVLEGVNGKLDDGPVILDEKDQVRDKVGEV